MYSFHLFLISSLSTRSLPFLSFIVPIFGRVAPLMLLIFLKRSLVFPLLLFSSIFKHCLLKKAFFVSSSYSLKLCISPLLFSSLHSSTIHKASSDNHFASLLFFFFGIVSFWDKLRPVQYYRPLSIVLQTHCYLDLVPWIYSLPLLWIHMGFYLSHNLLPWYFPGFLYFKP